MNKIIMSLFLSLYSLSLMGQDTSYTIKTINKDRIIEGYLIVKIFNNKIISTERIESYRQLKKKELIENTYKIKIDLKSIPNDKLKPEEYLKNNIRDNGR